MTDVASRPPAYPSEGVRTGVSLTLFIHGFCVVTVLSSHFSFSQLQGKLVSLFSPYTRALHLDPNYFPVARRLAALPPIPFHLTSGEAETRMHQWQVITASDATLRLPDAGWTLPHRWDRGARVAGYFHERLESDEVPAELVRSLSRYLYPQLDAEARSGPWAVRCVRYLGSTAADGRDQDQANVEVRYEADVWFVGPAEAPQINVLKRAPPSQSAPPIGITESP